MQKRKFDGMQQLTCRSTAKPEILLPVPVNAVANDRRSKRGGVYAYLMHPPRVDAELDKRNSAALREKRPMRHGRETVAPDRRVDRAAVFLRRAMHHGEIRLADGLVGL
jgi:hypothetical protein